MGLGKVSQDLFLSIGVEKLDNKNYNYFANIFFKKSWTYFQK